MLTRSARHSTKSLLISLGLALLAAVLLPPATCEAQSPVSGKLVGRVQDRSGRALDDVRIRLTNVRTSNRRTRRTDDQGYFEIPYLRSGTYRIQATKQGFFTEVIPDFTVRIARPTEVKLPKITLRQAAIQGRILDRAGNGLGGARVVVNALRGRVSVAAVTDNFGNYAVRDLPPGAYLVTAAWESEGGEGRGSLNVMLNRPETSAPALRLMEVMHLSTQQPAPATATGQSDDGEKDIALLHTVDAARVRNFGELQLNSLPVGGTTPMRSFDEFALLVAGVAPPPYTPGVRGPGIGFGIGTAGQFSVNGMRARSNNFSVDGSDNNDPDVGVRRQGFIALVPQSVESVKDFSISTLLWDAEMGRNFGSQVNAVSDYGGNAFHGELYALVTDSRLNARNFFDYEGGPSGGKDALTHAQAGLTFGGPVKRDRTHFFTSYEHQQFNASTEHHFSTPAAAERSFLGGRGFRTELGNETSLLWGNTTPLGARILSFYPLPNNPVGPYGPNNFTRVINSGGRGDIFSLMMSHQVTPDHLLSMRYNFAGDRRVLPSVNRALNSTLNSRTRSQNHSLIFDGALGNSISNQLRFTVGRTRLNFFELPGSPFIFQSSGRVTALRVQGGQQQTFTAESRTGPIGELIIEPFSPVGIGAYDFPQRRASTTFQLANSTSAVRGAHSFKFGANVRCYYQNSGTERLYRPRSVFSGQTLLTLTSGFGRSETREELIPGVRQAALGRPSSIFQTITSGPPNSTIALRSTDYHAFVNDNWRVHPRFTLDLGLRYEYNTVPTEANGRIEDALTLRNLPTAGASIFDTPLTTAIFNDAVAAYRRVLGGRTQIYDPDRNNFGPRAGFAWSLDPEGKTVLRAGYGVYFDTILGAVVSQSRNVFPNELPINLDPDFFAANAFSLFRLENVARSVTDDEGNVRRGFFIRQTPCNQFGTCNQFGSAPEDFAALVGDLLRLNENGGLAFTLPEKRLRTPYAQQWHLTVERELYEDLSLSAAYVGTQGTKLLRLTTPNLGPNVLPNDRLQVRAPPNNPVPLVLIGDVSTFLCRAQEPCPNSFANRPNRVLGPYQIFESSASSSYHALQVEAHTRYGRGYQFTAAYTWSHAVDDVSDLFPIAGAPVLAQNSFDLRAERADANFDVRHRFAASAVWDLPPFARAGRAARLLLSGWQVASVFHAHTGQPFTLGVPLDVNLDGNLTDRPTTTDGLVFFDEHGPRRVALAPGRQLSDFLPRPRIIEDDADFFSDRLVFGNGQVGRNTARAGGLVNLDLAFSKRFRLADDRALTLRTEIFNVLNRANFGTPVRLIGAPGFGSAVETATPARVIQFALRYDF